MKSAADREALTRNLQTALNRVGCYRGKIDGQWGATGRAGLAKFVKAAKLPLTTDEPSMAALEAVAARTRRVCPLECGDGKVESNGKCVARPDKPKDVEVNKRFSGD